MGERRTSELSDAELNYLTAERMGLTYRIYDHGEVLVYWPTGETTSWDPCNRADHWWRVVEWLIGRGFSVEIYGSQGGYAATIWGIDDVIYDKQGDTAGRAICQAYIEATG